MDIDRWIIRALESALEYPEVTLWCVVAWTVLCLGFGSTLA